ncbi:MAG: lytic transglycosylase domain-containing protein [Acidobacteria bacterium]|nr:lytic transglycosylase domain-containing protein [Acidobacteriota bacterium]
MSAMHKLLYQRIVFCHKCGRSMFVGPNARYLVHLARHTAVNKLLIFVAVLGLISFAPSTISIMSARKVGLANYISEEQLKQEKIVQGTLRKYSNIKPEQINRLTKIIVRNAQNKKLDPKLIASIIVVESHGNPTAISEAKSVGLMQVHVPTWGGVIDFTERNPFDPEVNIDVGATILADYLKRYKDLETALAAYEGTHDPTASEYVGKVMDLYRPGTRPIRRTEELIAEVEK